MFVLASINVKAQTEPIKKQCIAMTQKGVKCKKTAIQGQLMCAIHSDSRNRCGATTASGKLCKLGVKNAGETCRFHKLQPKQ